MHSGRDHLRGEARRVADRVSAVVAAGRGPSPEKDVEEDAGEHVDGSGGENTDGTVGATRLGPRQRGERLSLRIDPGRRSTAAIALVVVAAAVVTGLWVLASRPRTMPVSAAPSITGASPLTRASGASNAVSASTPPPLASSPAGEVVVDVAGKVRTPGLYRLPPGSRIDDAIKAAGGALRGVDLTSLNLAAPLVDGQQIAVGRPGAAAQPPGSAGPGSGTLGASGGAAGSGGLVDLNTASLDQLQDLPGIGPALAQRILDFRTQHGSFASVDQLDDVSGIGTVTFARLKALVTV